MRQAAAIAVLVCLCATSGTQAQDFLDRVDEALTFTGFNNNVRARVSGTLDLEGYAFSGPAPGLIRTTSDALFNPRLSLFLDTQVGPAVYVFTQTRLDRGFDPTDHGAQIRLDEYAVRVTPWEDGRFTVQAGQFSTVIGNWTSRHLSWDNPFINAPLPYENVTGIWDIEAPEDVDDLFGWAHVGEYDSGDYSDKYLRLPIIWGPSYASGFALLGTIEKFDYAFELKNSALASRPE